MCGLYTIRMGKTVRSENQACGIAKYPGLLVHRHEARITPAKRRRHPHNSAILVALQCSASEIPESIQTPVWGGQSWPGVPSGDAFSGGWTR